ncbi:unnamed protein product, partial [Musa hybrid cultivar]
MAVAPPPASSKAIRHPPRPGFGTVVRKCLVRANHFLVEVADKDLVRYNVAITPGSTSRVTNRKVITELVMLHKDGILGRRMPAYDGWKRLYTAGTLPFEVKDFIIKLPEKDQRREKEFKVAIWHAGNPSLHTLKEFLCCRQIDVPKDVLRESLSSKYTTVTRSFFSPMLGHRAE